MKLVSDSVPFCPSSLVCEIMVGKCSPSPFSIEDLCTAPMVSWESQTQTSYTPRGPSEQIVEIKLASFLLVTSSVSIGNLWCLLLCLFSDGFVYLFNKTARTFS